MINFVYCRSDKNIGDMVCTPAMYFNLNDNSQPHNLSSINHMGLNNDIILGGGGLISEHFKNNLNIIGHLKRLGHIKKLICWGVGINVHYSHDIDNTNFFRAFLNECDIIGLRDYNIDIVPEYTWVPCASCMSNIFDYNFPVTDKIVIYEHLDVPIKIYGDIPRATNESTDFIKTIKFLASAEVVITNSYHGVYWSTLLKKKVLVIPFSQRFDNFKHSPTVCTADNWYEKLKDARTYPTALEECRDANLDFFVKVFKYLKK